MQPNEWIGTLEDLEPLPSGIWIVSKNSTEYFFDEGKLALMDRGNRWILSENLPEELRREVFYPVETFRRGNVTAIYCCRKLEN